MPALFGILFGGAGLLILADSFVLPLMEWSSSRDWEPVTAEIVESRIEGSGDEAEAVIRYTYSYQGKEQTGERLSFWDDTSLFSSGTQFLESYKKGTVVSCWIDPDHPEVSVLTRQLSLGGMATIFFTIPFLLVGVCGLTMAFGPRLVARGFYRKWYRPIPAMIAEGVLPDWVESQRIPPPNVYALREIRARSFGLILFLNLFWNSIAMVPFVAVTLALLTGNAEKGSFGAVLFLIPFVAIGTWFILILVRMLKASPPDYVFALDPAPSGEGGPVRISWGLEPGKPLPERVEITATHELLGLDDNGDPVRPSPNPFDQIRKRRWQPGPGSGRPRTGDIVWEETFEVGPNELMSGSRLLALPAVEQTAQQDNALRFYVTQYDRAGNPYRDVIDPLMAEDAVTTARK